MGGDPGETLACAHDAGAKTLAVAPSFSLPRSHKAKPLDVVELTATFQRTLRIKACHQRRWRACRGRRPGASWAGGRVTYSKSQVDR